VALKMKKKMFFEGSPGGAKEPPPEYFSFIREG
jgi:hypothetical protein